MAIFLTGRSAFELHNSPDFDRRPLPVALGVSPSNFGKPTSEDIDRALHLSLSEPIDVVVSEKSCRNRSKKLSCSIATSELPANSFDQLSDSVFLASPELLFVERARQGSLIDTIRFGYYICGTYSFPIAGSTVRERAPRTSIAKLSAYVRECRSITGIKIARQAIRYIQDNSASPRETVLAMLLSLPPHLGGYGLPAPVLNHQTMITDPSTGVTSFRRSDLFWPSANIDLEYDSTQWHTGATALDRDSKRRADLELTEVHVLTCTNNQVQNAAEFEKLARIIAKALKVKLRHNRYASFCEKRTELRKALGLFQ